MSLRWKILSIVAIGFATAVYFQLGINNKQMKQKVMEREADRAQQLASVLIQATELKTVLADQQLQQTANRLWNQKVKKDSTLPEDLMAIALLRLDPAGHWSVSRQQMQNEARTLWGEDLFSDLPSRLPLARVKRDMPLWARVMGKDNQPALTMIKEFQIQLPGTDTGTDKGSDKRTESVESAIVVGLYKAELLNSVLAQAKAFPGQMMVVNDQGHALVMSEQRYLGARVDTMPHIARLLHSDLKSGADFSESLDAEGESYVTGYDHSDQTNLTAFIEIDSSVLNTNESVTTILLLFGLGAIFALLTGIVFYLCHPWEAGIRYFKSLVRGYQPGELPSPPTGVAAEFRHLYSLLSQFAISQGPGVSDESRSTEETINNDTILHKTTVVDPQTSTLLALGVSNQLHEISTAMSAYMRLIEAKLKLKDSEAFESLDKELRRTRKLAGELELFAGKYEAFKENILIGDFLAEYKQKKKFWLLERNMSLEIIAENPVHVSIDRRRFELLLEELLRSTAHFLQGQHDKCVRVAIRQEEHQEEARVSIEWIDGIPLTERQQGFAPFTSLNEVNLQSIMGPSLIAGIVVGMSGEFQFTEGGLILNLPLADSLSSKAIHPSLPPLKAPVESEDSLYTDSIHQIATAPLIPSSVPLAKALPTEKMEAPVEEDHSVNDGPSSDLLSHAEDEEDPFSSISVSELNGRSPLVGSDLQVLPAKPQKQDTEFDLSEFETLDFNQINEHEADVRIRKPHVKVDH